MCGGFGFPRLIPSFFCWKIRLKLRESTRRSRLLFIIISLCATVGVLEEGLIVAAGDLGDLMRLLLFCFWGETLLLLSPAILNHMAHLDAPLHAHRMLFLRTVASWIRKWKLTKCWRIKNLLKATKLFLHASWRRVSLTASVKTISHTF